MSSINQVDVAAIQNSGSSIVQVAKGGKRLPTQHTGGPDQKPSKRAVNDIKPQNEVTGKTDLTGDPIASIGLGAEGTTYDSEQIRIDTIASAVTKLNDYVQKEERDVEFSVKDEVGLSVVKVINRHSRELIRQIPNEEVVDLARKLNDQEPLRLFSAQV
jgi:uncharacterized FlaG/YvyC family protein